MMPCALDENYWKQKEVTIYHDINKKSLNELSFSCAVYQNKNHMVQHPVVVLVDF